MVKPKGVDFNKLEHPVLETFSFSIVQSQTKCYNLFSVFVPNLIKQLPAFKVLQTHFG